MEGADLKVSTVMMVFSYMEYNNTGMCWMEEGWWNDRRVEHLVCLLGCMLHESRYCACMTAKLFQSCPSLCDTMDCSPQGSSVHGILQARILEWVAMPSSRGSSLPRHWTRLLCALHWQAGSLPLVPPGKPESRYHFCLIHLSESLAQTFTHKYLVINKKSFSTDRCQLSYRMSSNFVLSICQHPKT